MLWDTCITLSYACMHLTGGSNANYILGNITSISFFGATNSCLLAMMAIIFQEFPFAWFQIVLCAVFKALNFPGFFK